MKKILLEVTDELAQVLDAARGDTARNPFIEQTLRRSTTIRRTAKDLGIEFPARPGMGRPPRNEDE